MEDGRRSRVTRTLCLTWTAAACAATVTCADPLDLCTPKQARFDFFSKGDCMLTRASFFQGHEWLSYFANEDLPAGERFGSKETLLIAEGNRRVDWPKELLYHMNGSIFAYAEAVEEHAERPENQKSHFLLTDRNTSAEAAAEARAEVRRLTRQATELWLGNRVRALTLVGQASHIVQDAHSTAHAVRDPLHPEHPWCVTKVKAYIERAEGFDTPDIEYHSDRDDDTVGHTTTQDSIYREGRDCHQPVGRAAVEACLSDSARQARRATADYLLAVRAVVRAWAAAPDALDTALDEHLEPFMKTYLELCP